MLGYSGIYCIETGDRLQRYRRTKFSKKRLPMFPMDTAIIAYDYHGNYVVYTLMYEPLARGTSGGKDAGIKAAHRLQRKITDIKYEHVRYITRCGVTVTEQTDVYKIGGD